MSCGLKKNYRYIRNVIVYGKSIALKAFLYKFIRSINRLKVKSFDSFNIKLKNKNFKTIFIIGAPRSGSTFLEQLLINAFNVSYYSNYNYAFPHLESNAIDGLRHRNRVPFRSFFGHTYSFNEPNEGNEYLEHLFEIHDEVERTAMLSKLVVRDRNLVFKNIRHSLAILDLIKKSPSIYGIITKREIICNIQSSYQAFLKLGTYHPVPWQLSTDNICDDPLIYAVRQIYFIYLNILNKIREINSDKYLVVSYEDACDNTNKVLSQISNHFSLEPVSMFLDLTASKKINFKESEIKIIRNELEDLQSMHGELII